MYGINILKSGRPETAKLINSNCHKMSQHLRRAAKPTRQKVPSSVCLWRLDSKCIPKDLLAIADCAKDGVQPRQRYSHRDPCKEMETKAILETRSSTLRQKKKVSDKSKSKARQHKLKESLKLQVCEQHNQISVKSDNRIRNLFKGRGHEPGLFSVQVRSLLFAIQVVWDGWTCGGGGGGIWRWDVGQDRFVYLLFSFVTQSVTPAWGRGWSINSIRITKVFAREGSSLHRIKEESNWHIASLHTSN